MDESKSSGRSRASSTQLTAEAAGMLQEGINLVLSEWTALQMAVRNEWGGPHTRFVSHQLALDLFSLLTRSNKEVEASEVVFIMKDSFRSMRTIVEDGSLDEVANIFVRMRKECLEGNFSSIQWLRAKNRPTGAAATHVTKIQNDSDSDRDDYNDNESFVDDDVYDDSNESDYYGDNEDFVEDDSAEMLVDIPQSHAVVNSRQMMIKESRDRKPAETEDGWTIVASKRKREKELGIRSSK